jgi:chemotaxis protein CheY-P-specific phosphatase CheC
VRTLFCWCVLVLDEIFTDKPEFSLNQRSLRSCHRKRVCVLDAPSVNPFLRFQLQEALKSGEQLVVVSVEITGAADGNLLLVFTKPDALTIVKLLLCDDDNLEAMQESTLTEIGNIVLSNFLTSMSEFSGVDLLHEIPKLHSGSQKTLVPCVALQLPQKESSEGILLTSSFEVDSTVIEGHLFLFPGHDLLRILVKTIRLMLG